MNKPVLNGLFFIVIFFGLQNIGFAQSQADSDPIKSLVCLITTDFYIVHLTAYQEPKNLSKSKKRKKFEPFCQTLPNDGPSFLSIDFIDRDLRKMSIAMRVIEEAEDPKSGEMVEVKAIADKPAQIYKNGVAQIQADFPKPGHYALIAMVGDDMFADKIRIPLRVGIGEAFSWGTFFPYIIFIITALLSYGIYRYFSSRYNRKNKNEQG